MRALLLLLVLASPALADDKLAPAKSDDSTAPAASPAPANTVDDKTVPPASFHKGQVGVSVRLDVGAQAIATYDSKYYCGTVDSTALHGFAPVCAGRSPVSLGLEGSYGIAKHIELVLEIRLGLEKDFGGAPSMDGPHPLFVAPGARFFFSEAKRTKLFVQPEVVFDFTGYKDSAGQSRGNDFGFRGLEGIWLDLHRSYGIYGYVGETLEFARWIDAGFEVGAGFQGRYP